MDTRVLKAGTSISLRHKMNKILKAGTLLVLKPGVILDDMWFTTTILLNDVASHDHYIFLTRADNAPSPPYDTNICLKLFDVLEP